MKPGQQNVNPLEQYGMQPDEPPEEVVVPEELLDEDEVEFVHCSNSGLQSNEEPVSLQQSGVLFIHLTE